MKIGILIGKPTQFEGPFFRHMARNTTHALCVVYTNSDQIEKIFDPEIGTSFSWGINLLDGYPYAVVPKRGRLRWLFRHFRQQKYDFVILNGYRGEYLFAAFAARLFGIPVALRLDSVLFDNVSVVKRLLKKTLFFFLSRLYAHFFAVGSLSVQYLEHFGISRQRISIFSYAVDVDYFKIKSCLSFSDKRALKHHYGLPEHSTVVLSVSKFNGREAPWDLLIAFCSMQSQDLWLLLVGDGEQRARLQEYAQAHSGRVVFAGYVPYPELPSVYSIADVFVHPVHDEPWGVSVAEAQACGLPVIASSRVGAGYDHITPGVNGYVYKAGDAEDLRNKLSALLAFYQPADIRRENDRILAQWNYATTLKTVVEASERCLKT